MRWITEISSLHGLSILGGSTIRVFDEQRTNMRHSTIADAHAEKIQFFTENKADATPAGCPVIDYMVDSGQASQGTELDSQLRYFSFRYMRANGSTEWLGDDETPLQGFSWRSGCERDTTGILVWNEIFKVSDLRYGNGRRLEKYCSNAQD